MDDPASNLMHFAAARNGIFRENNISRVRTENAELEHNLSNLHNSGNTTIYQNTGSLLIPGAGQNPLIRANSGSVSSVTTGSNTLTLTKTIDICNEINQEKDCELTMCMVRKCTREEIWNENKFLTDNVIKKLKIDENSMNEKNILSVLLRRTRKLDIDIFDRLKFWRKYSKEVQKELNTMKSTCTKQIKEIILRSK